MNEAKGDSSPQPASYEGLNTSENTFRPEATFEEQPPHLLAPTRSDDTADDNNVEAKSGEDAAVNSREPASSEATSEGKKLPILPVQSDEAAEEKLDAGSDVKGEATTSESSPTQSDENDNMEAPETEEEPPVNNSPEATSEEEQLPPQSDYAAEGEVGAESEAKGELGNFPTQFDENENKEAPEVEEEPSVINTPPTEDGTVPMEPPQTHSYDTPADNISESKPQSDFVLLTTTGESALQSDAGDEEAPKNVESPVKNTESMVIGTGVSKHDDNPTAYASKAVVGGVTAAANKTVVEHRIFTEPTTQTKTRTARFLDPIFGMSKPVLGIVLLYTLFSTGAWAYLLQNSFALTAQVEELEAQVDRLATEVDDLETQVNRYQAENDILEENIEDFAELNRQLNASNAEFAAQNARLNESVEELEDQNDRLNASNAEYALLNAELNETAHELESQVDELEAAVDEIGETVLEAARQNEELFNETELLQQLNGTLSEQVDAINGVVIDMNSEIAELNDLVDELKTILSFLEEAVGNIGDAFEDVAKYLAEQIETNRGLLKETLQNTYEQISASWVCTFRALFSGEPFVEDGNVPIGESAYPDVIAFVESEVLEPLCLDTSDFESFLALDIGSNVPPVDVTFNQLISAVSEYTTAARNYYFPDEGETGLTDEDWVAAQYSCENLPDEKKFTLSIA